MKNHQKPLVELNQEIPSIQKDKEGKLKGGFVPFDSSNPVEAIATNLNCPKAGTCTEAPPENGTYTNINCPQGPGATCGTTESTEPEGDGLNGITFGGSSLI